MRRSIMAAAAFFALADSALADPVLGLWQTEAHEGKVAQVRMAPCGPAICGLIERTFDAEGSVTSEDLDRTLVIYMMPVGEGSYAGQAVLPSQDRTYVGLITLRGDSLRLRGCTEGGAICSAEEWLRVP